MPIVSIQTQKGSPRKGSSREAGEGTNQSESFQAETTKSEKNDND